MHPVLMSFAVQINQGCSDRYFDIGCETGYTGNVLTTSGHTSDKPCTEHTNKSGRKSENNKKLFSELID